MNDINWNGVRESLRELSDIGLQRKLWLSDGSGGSDVSSFSEAVEQLFSDTGLTCELQDMGTGLGTEIDDLFHLLEQEISKVGIHSGPASTIADAYMVRVRALANELLERLRIRRARGDLS